MKLYGLVDCNNFFVSCERLFRPDLNDYPTVVAGSNDGVIVARSEEAKQIGIPMGVPRFQVEDILKKHKVAVFSGNFELYRDISRRVMNVLRTELEQVYQYSVDEAFFELEAKGAKERLRQLKTKIEKCVGVPVSLGAGATMTIAKYASEREKRCTGVCVLKGQAWQALTTEIELSDIWGVGGATSKKFRANGIDSVADFLTVDVSRLEKLFGVHGLRLRSELAEIPAHHPGEHAGFQKSIMSTRSFAKPVANLPLLEEAISYHVAKVAAELREIGGQTGLIRILLGTSRHGDWVLKSKSKEVILVAPTDDTRELLKEAITAIREIYESGVPYKKAGVVLGRITSATEMQLDLFASDQKRKRGGLMKVFDQLNSKWGEEIVAVGRVIGREAGLTKHSQRSPRYTTRWDELRWVRD